MPGPLRSVSILDHSKKLQPRKGKTDRKAGSGLRQADDDGDADDGAH